MKNRVGILFAVIALLGGLVYWAWFQVSDDDVSTSSGNESVVDTSDNAKTSNEPLPFKSTLVPGKPDGVVLAERKAKKDLKSLLSRSPWAKKMYSLAEAQKDPVGFYAKIIDQYGHSVEGVKVRVGLGGVYGATSIQTTSDAQGRFSVKGVEATSMGAEEMLKSGYEFYLRGVYFLSYVRNGGHNRVWSDYTQENPFIYHAWKLGEPALLLHEDSKLVRLKPDVTYTVYFDRRKLVEEGRNEGGDLWITLVRPLNITPQDTIDWSIRMETVDGGLLETDDLFMYEAPESGYQSVWEEHSAQVRASEWINHKFYIKTRNGASYGRVMVEIAPVYGSESSAIDFNYWINQNSSRNLYYNSRYRIFPH